MTTGATALRADLSRRIRAASPQDWSRFTTLWMAFNAMYGGEVDRRERARVMSAVRRHLSSGPARAVLQRCDVAAQRILAIPPGNMMLERWDPRFRQASRRLAQTYHARSSTPLDRLAALAGILYQVRCNLVHGSKDPRESRDRILVRESVRILDVLVPELEAAVARG